MSAIKEMAKAGNAVFMEAFTRSSIPDGVMEGMSKAMLTALISRLKAGAPFREAAEYCRENTHFGAGLLAKCFTDMADRAERGEG